MLLGERRFLRCTQEYGDVRGRHGRKGVLMDVRKPSWFSDDKVLVSTAPTCGMSKGGRLLPLVDRVTGARVRVEDPETGEVVDAVDDQLRADMDALAAGNTTPTLRFVDRAQLDMNALVPVYYDRRFEEDFCAAMKTEQYADFTSATLGDLVKQGIISIRGGHGSPPSAQRVGPVPYIKVSDLRAGLVNINPTNRVPLKIAQHYWRGENSGLRAFDLLCPERTSKNIGDFCLLMPGQEQVLLTKEIIVLRVEPRADFDAFYLHWAMTLKIVRDQWKRFVFMQINREDVGKRYLQISIPVPRSAEKAREASNSFRAYFQAIADARLAFSSYLADTGDHHFFISDT
jgi:type I restriction enzyme M protein